MNPYVFLSLGVSLFASQLAAQDVGILFDEMPVGTQIITQSVDPDRSPQLSEYIGLEDGLHVMSNSRLQEDGEVVFLNTTHYDGDGRQVRSNNVEVYSAYEPFSCRYAVGDCTQSWTYPNSLEAENAEYFTKEQSFQNRLDGTTFTVGMLRDDGSLRETTYELGPYNLRISSRYTRYNGETRGYDLVEIIEP